MVMGYIETNIPLESLKTRESFWNWILIGTRLTLVQGPVREDIHIFHHFLLSSESCVIFLYISF